MYGLLLDTIQKFIREKYGENYWVNIRRRAKLSNHWFVTHEFSHVPKLFCLDPFHCTVLAYSAQWRQMSIPPKAFVCSYSALDDVQVYQESVIPTLVDAAAEELGEEKDNVMMMFGEYFAENIGRYGYARLLRVLGRDLRDFLNGLVDLHEYLRFSYPNMSPPAFFTANETPEGLHLHYITKREGFLCYVIGQMKTIGKIYGKQLEISVISEDQTDKGENHYILDLKFDNRAMLMTRRASVVGFVDFQISSETFFKMFPFSFIFSKELVICRVGRKLQEVLPGLYGEVVSSAFTLLKPYMAELDWDSIQLRTNCTFELQSVRQVQCTTQDQEVGVVPEQAPLLKLKGEMMPLDEQEYMAFLCSPAMDSPEDLYESGIFISDLSLHNCSREFIMAGSQKHPELNIAFSQERIRSAQLETSIKKTDELLYQMIPKSIADKLRSGQPPLSTCQEFDSVSILFSDIVSFTPMCTRLGPMQVVCVLNSMCTAYDRLCEKYNVYKVEMIGDAYMVLAGGPIPSRSDVHHVESITNYGLGILEATKNIIDPSTNKHLGIRVGIHSGGIVAGVVGTSTQRYDVFGDTVNIAARMESTGEPMRIQVSEATAFLLKGKRFILSERGQVEVKGKGLMKTFWVDGKEPDTGTTTGSTSRAMSLSSWTSPRSNSSGTLQPRLSPAPRSLRRGSPAPDEWPQAELRLGDRHDPRNHRSHTIPNIDVSSFEHELQSLLCPFDPATPLAASRAECPLTAFSYPQNCHSSPTSHPSSPLQTREREANGGRNADGERYLTQVRQSLAQGLATITENGLEDISVSQLEEFAAIAEENARTARLLADTAAELAKTRRKHPSHDGPSLEGSSVDPPPAPNSRQYFNYCSIL